MHRALGLGLTCMKRLQKALDELLRFLERVETPAGSTAHWREQLSRIRTRLEAADGRAAALNDLDRCFGGMGSLNDVFFSSGNGNVPPGSDAQSLNRELDMLLDRTFQELRLVNGPVLARVYWWWLSLRHRGPAPRILNAFGANPPPAR